jgi:hypothetical protein
MGYTASGQTGNPVLDEISAAHANLSPQAQQAIEGAHGMLGISPSHSDPALAASAAPNPELAVPGVSGPRGPLPILSPETPAPSVMIGGPSDADPYEGMSVPEVKGTPMADGQSENGEIADLDRTRPQGLVAAPKPVSAAVQERSRLTAPPLPSSDPNAHTSADTGRPGVEQIHNPWLRALGTVADVVASGAFPRLGQFIPGSSAHHGLLVSQSEKAVGDEQAGAKSAADVARTEAETENRKAETSGLPAKAKLEEAQAENYISEADARKNPDLQVVAHPVIDPNDTAKTPRTGYFNKKTGEMTYGPEIAAAPVSESSKPTVEKMDNGDVVAIHYDPATKKSRMEIVYHGDPKVETDITKLEVDGKPHSVVVNKKTGATIKDLGETGEKPPTVNVNQGAWAIEEDADGKPVEYNSKTGETRPVAPGGVQKAGTKAKGDAAKQPAKDAMNYAETYLQAPAHTGSGDEALQEKFFELAKPTTGFRMTQPQMDMLQNSRSWMGSLAAHIRHATTGTWFDDTQRKQIVDTMRDLAKAKGVGTENVGHGSSGTTHYVDGGQGYDIPADKVAAFEAAHPNAQKH